MKKLLLILALLAGSFACVAQTHESLNVVVTMPVGTGNDILARQWVKKYDETFGTSSTIINKPGADGVIGIKYFLGLKEANNTVPVLWPAIGHIVGYTDTDRSQIVPNIELSRTPWILIARKDFPANNFKEYVDYVRANPGKVNQGVAGGSLWAGMINHVSANTGTKVNIVNYANSSQMVDVAKGVLDTAWGITSNVIGTGIESRVKIIATGSTVPLEGYVDIANGNNPAIGPWYTYQGVFLNASLPAEMQSTIYRRFEFIRGLPWAKEMANRNNTFVTAKTNHKEFEQNINSLTQRLKPEVLQKKK